MKLLSIFAIEVQVAKLFDNFRLCMKNKLKLEKLRKVAKNFNLEAQKLLRIYDLSLENLRLKGVENGVAYKKSVSSSLVGFLQS